MWSTQKLNDFGLITNVDLLGHGSLVNSATGTVRTSCTDGSKAPCSISVSNSYLNYGQVLKNEQNT